MTADQYLELVSLQAQSLPDVFVASAAATTTRRGKGGGREEEDGDESTNAAGNGAGVASGYAAVDHHHQSLSGKKRKRGEIKDQQRASAPVIGKKGCAASIELLIEGGRGARGLHKQFRGATTSSHLVPAPTSLYLPLNPREWTDSTLAQFSSLRLYLDRLHLQLLQQQQQHRSSGSSTSTMNRYPVPALKDRDGWIRFCLGSSAAAGAGAAAWGRQGDENAKRDDDDDDGGNDDNKKENDPSLSLPLPPNPSESSSSAKHGWLDQLPSGGYRPEVGLLLQMDQVMTRRVLEHLVDRCCCDYNCDGGSAGPADDDDNIMMMPSSPVLPPSLEESMGRWLYALLARLERPLHRDDASTVYRLVKCLAHDRATLQLLNNSSIQDVDDRRFALARLNVLITIGGVYFEQGGFHAVMTAKDPAEDGANVEHEEEAADAEEAKAGGELAVRAPNIAGSPSADAGAGAVDVNSPL